MPQAQEVTVNHLRLWFSLLLFFVAVLLFKAGDSLCEKTCLGNVTLVTVKEDSLKRERC